MKPSSKKQQQRVQAAVVILERSPPLPVPGSRRPVSIEEAIKERDAQWRNIAERAAAHLRVALGDVEERSMRDPGQDPARRYSDSYSPTENGSVGPTMTPAFEIDEGLFEPCGDDASDDPDERDGRLALVFQLNGTNMHLEAIPVRDCPDLGQQGTDSTSSSRLDGIATEWECRFETTRLRGADYVIVATPFSD